MSPVESGNSEPESLNKSSSGANGSTLSPRLSFGLYEIGLHAHELRKAGLRLKIPHQSFQILAMLLERPGEVVSREDLRRKLWPSDVFVNFEAGLNSAVQRLRSALQDTSLEPRYIETLPRVGYRFIASVEALTPVSEIPLPQNLIMDDAPPSAATSDSAEVPLVETASDQFSTIAAVKGRSSPYWAAAALILVLFVAYLGHRYS